MGQRGKVPIHPKVGKRTNSLPNMMDCLHSLMRNILKHMKLILEFQNMLARLLSMELQETDIGIMKNS